jgi:hypothetical protein
MPLAIATLMINLIKKKEQYHKNDTAFFVDVEINPA